MNFGQTWKKFSIYPSVDQAWEGIALREKIFEYLDLFRQSQNIYLEVINNEGELLREFGEDPWLFLNNIENLPFNTNFKDALIEPNQAPKHEKQIFIVQCTEEIVFFSVPVFVHNSRVGTVIAGPVLLKEAEFVQAIAFGESYQLDMQYLSGFFEALLKTPVVKSERISSLVKLLACLINQENIGSVGVVNLHAVSSGKSIQDSDLQRGEDAHQSVFEIALNSMTNQFLRALTGGDEKIANALLNEILGKILFSPDNSMQRIKASAVDLVYALEKNYLENKKEINHQKANYLRYKTRIDASVDMIEVSYSLLEVLKELLPSVFFAHDLSHVPTIKQAIKFIKENYSRNPKLAEIAAEVGLNGSYLSNLFKKETGTSISEFILKLKIEQARLLLKDNKLSIDSVAAAVGFKNQSYFTKIFKRYQGATPSQYRLTI